MRGEASTVNGSPSKPLSKNDMYALFDALSERLAAKRARANIYLVVTGASAEHMLAMKLEAGRGRDMNDIATLVRMLGLRSAEEGVAIHRRLLPHSNKNTRTLMEDALARRG